MNAVTKLNKNYLRIGFVISLLIVIASICERVNTDSILRTTNGILLGLIRSSIYIGMFAAWRFSVRQRIVPKNTRRYLSAVAFFLILWMVIRTVKYYFVVDPNINRILWYCYYIPISIKKMAEKMFVEESTVKTHLKSIYLKVGCANKTELLVLVMQAKLVLPKKQEN